MARRFVWAAIVCGLAACAPIPSRVPSNVTTGAHVLPQPVAAASDAAPRIVAARFNTLNVTRPATWSGTIVTSTNVASVELKTDQFSLNLPRKRFGVFEFHVSLYDVPPEFIRRYDLRVIARNTAGRKAEEDIPFAIR